MRAVIRRTVKVALWLVGGVAGLGIVLGAILIWRLSSGPIPLDFLTPAIDKALDASLPGRAIDVQGTVLAWDAEQRHPLIQAQGVTLRDEQGQILATLSEIDVWLSLSALVNGAVGLTAIVLHDIQLTLIRGTDGSVRFGAAVTDTPTPTESGHPPSESETETPEPGKPPLQMAADILNSLVRDTDPARSLDYLQEIRLTHGALTLEDEQLGVTWRMPQIDFAVSRHHGSLTGKVYVSMPALGTAATIDASISFDRTTEQFAIEASFADVRPAMLASNIPAVDGLSGVNLPLNGGLTMDLDLQGIPREARFELMGGPGTFAYADVLPKPRDVASILVRGRVDGTQEAFHLDDTTIAFGTAKQSGPVIKLTANGQKLKEDLSVTARTTLTALPITALRDYWPAGIGPNPRAWLTENLTDGVMEQASATIELVLSRTQLRAAHVQSLAGTLRYRDLQVHYLRPLPPVVQVTGRGQFNLQGFHLQIDQGALEALTITAGKVDITGIDRRREAIATQVDLQGPLRDVLTVLNHPPLNLFDKAGLDPATVDGQVTTTAAFALPLRGTVPFEKVDMTVNGRLRDVAMQGIAQEHNIEHGDLTLQLSSTEMILEGALEAAQVPLTLRWHEALSKKPRWRREIRAIIPQVGVPDLARFGIEATDVMQGTFAADVTARMGREEQGEVVVDLNLQETRLMAPFLDWHKAVGEPGNARGTLQLVKGKPVALSQLDIAAGTLSARGSAQFASSGNDTARLDLKDVVLANSHLRSASVQYQHERLDVVVGEGVLDAAPWLQGASASGKTPTAPKAVQNMPETPRASRIRRFHLHAPALRRISFGDGRYLQNVGVSLTHRESGWERVEIGGQLPQSRGPQTAASQQAQVPDGQSPLHGFTMSYHPSSQGSYTLAASVDNVGDFLYALKVFDGVTGGRLTLEGNADRPIPAGALQTTLEVRDFVLQNAPVLARVLAAVSLAGLLNQLTIDGLKFDRLSADAVLEGHLISLQRLDTYGGGLGLTAEGQIDFGAANVNVKGTVIPAYSVNTILGQIPLLNLLVGGKGQGIIATNYAVKGPFTDLNVTVNPISTLTPGFVRRVFDLGDDPSESEKVPQKAPHGEDRPVEK